jgi:hypothetical protein
VAELGKHGGLKLLKLRWCLVASSRSVLVLKPLMIRTESDELNMVEKGRKTG